MKPELIAITDRVQSWIGDEEWFARKSVEDLVWMFACDESLWKDFVAAVAKERASHVNDAYWEAVAKKPKLCEHHLYQHIKANGLDGRFTEGDPKDCYLCRKEKLNAKQD